MIGTAGSPWNGRIVEDHPTTPLSDLNGRSLAIRASPREDRNEFLGAK